jgi:outer membrane protein OmpA-like peptidoglycan-associated protein
MKNKFLSTTCLALCLGALALPAGTAQAQEIGSLHYYDVTQADYNENYHEWRHFLEYQLHREQCQKYVAPPAGYVMKGCHVYRVGTKVVEQVATTTTTTQTETRVAELTEPSAPYYTIYFDFDQSVIRGDERANLANAAQEMQKFNLREVTVSGYTDSSGADAYNQTLSEQRARTVAQALSGYGINAAVIDQQAFGENNQAVTTIDNVREQDNRRVIINYKR